MQVEVKLSKNVKSVTLDAETLARDMEEMYRLRAKDESVDKLLKMREALDAEQAKACHAFATRLQTTLRRRPGPVRIHMYASTRHAWASRLVKPQTDATSERVRYGALSHVANTDSFIPHTACEKAKYMNVVYCCWRLIVVTL